jgi:hypothetical protein
MLIQLSHLPSKRAEIVGGGGAQTALALLADESCVRDWTNCATLLGKLCADEESRELIGRLRAGGMY